jgi:hypothetical protein
MVGATESAPRESDSPRRAGLRCMLMSVERARASVVDSRGDPVTLANIPKMLGLCHSPPRYVWSLPRLWVWSLRAGSRWLSNVMLGQRAIRSKAKVDQFLSIGFFTCYSLCLYLNGCKWAASRQPGKASSGFIQHHQPSS